MRFPVSGYPGDAISGCHTTAALATLLLCTIPADEPLTREPTLGLLDGTWTLWLRSAQTTSVTVQPAGFPALRQ